MVVTNHRRNGRFHWWIVAQRSGSEIVAVGLQKSSGRQVGRAGGLEADGVGTEDRLPNLTLGQSLQSCDYWLLWFSLVIGMGAGFSYLSNLSKPRMLLKMDLSGH